MSIRFLGGPDFRRAGLGVFGVVGHDWGPDLEDERGECLRITSKLPM